MQITTGKICLFGCVILSLPELGRRNILVAALQHR